MSLLHRIFGFRIEVGPSASRVVLHNPFIFPNSYDKYDLAFRDVCCIKSPLCDVYHRRRPRLFCYNQFPFFFGMLFQMETIVCIVS